MEAGSSGPEPPDLKEGDEADTPRAHVGRSACQTGNTPIEKEPTWPMTRCSPTVFGTCW
jgi:hypothetical protein